MAHIQTTSEGVPVILLKEGSKQSRGRDAQRNNIQAAKLISEIISTSLGPRGMDKMLVDSLGDITITNDGATILKEIDVQHPAAKMMVYPPQKSKTVLNWIFLLIHKHAIMPCWNMGNPQRRQVFLKKRNLSFVVYFTTKTGIFDLCTI